MKNHEFSLYTNVVLCKNLPKYGLKKGDVATIVERFERSEEDGYILEFFDSEGNTLIVIPVLESDIEKPFANAVINYRRLAKSA